MLCETLHSARRNRIKTGFASIGFIFFLTAQAQAQDCRELFAAIRKEAMYCGFFCDQQKLQPLQEIYEKRCIASVVQPSLFDIDSAASESLQGAEYNDVARRLLTSK